MAIKYHIAPRRAPTNGPASKKYYAEITQRYKITEEQLIAEILDNSSLSEGDTLSVLSNLANLLKKHLREGRTVEVPQLGLIYMTFKSDGQSSKGDVNSNLINNVR